VSGPTRALEHPRAPLVVAVLLALAYVGVLWVNAPSVGYVRDEGYYFKAAEEYGRWWDTLFSARFLHAFSDEEIRLRFGYNTEHPALVKLTQGLCHRVLHEWLGVADPAQGYRAAGFLSAFLALLGTFALGRAMAGPWVGVTALVLLGTLPRWFFDAHLACFDVPMTAAWVWSLWAFWRAWTAPPDQVLRRSLVAGLIFGLAMATKLNAFFLPVVWVASWLWAGRALQGLRGIRGPSGGPDVALPRLPWPLVICALVGPLVFLAHWPYLWHDTVTRIGAYLAFHLNHEHYPASYFHALLVKPPFPVDFPFVMTAITVPSPTLVFGAGGLGLAMWRALRQRDERETYLVLATLVPILIIAMPSSPIFGGVKHWYNAMPSFAILAARGLVPGARAWATALAPRLRPLVAAAVIAIAALPGVLGIAASPATGIGFYNELAGGYRGGAELGMQRGFWGGLGRPSYDALNTLGPRTRVFFNRTNWDAFRMYQREGILRSDVFYANAPRGADASVHFEQPEHGEKEGEIWSAQGTRPVDGVYVDEVVLTQTYRRGASAGPPAR
jgi:4-amino-4-deoxy-L-arabinose transferase-like glycosyltransferase